MRSPFKPLGAAALNERMIQVLEAIVNEYITSAEPVGSRVLTRRRGVQFSPATVRNVMSDLEELGLLTQPHTSAGRLPTDRGLRYFIDTILKIRRLTARERESIRAKYAQSVGASQDVLHETGRVISDLTRMTGIVLAPEIAAVELKHVEFVKLRGGRVLAVLVSANGLVDNRLLEVSFDLSDSDLERIGNFLNARYSNRSLAEISAAIEAERADLKSELADLATRAELLSKAAFEPRGKREMVVEGRNQILAHPEFAANERWREISSALERCDELARLIERTIDGRGIRIFIGAETEIAELEDLAIVFRGYGGRPATADEANALGFGVVGVIGPRRMDYARVVPLVDYTAELVEGFLGES
ncbi:MAG: heat-inducible transcription repressor HrcA [Deltaproteobacteria bacterium]|nr:heat-inducible transcription repressor HrcA [Deltaproteobacteria bacterium]